MTDGLIATVLLIGIPSIGVILFSLIPEGRLVGGKGKDDGR